MAKITKSNPDSKRKGVKKETMPYVAGMMQFKYN
jgi:hypothetical protein